MNCDTVSQNDVSRSKQWRQRHHGDISNISATQDEPHNGSSSSNQPSSSYKLVSEHQGKDSEKCQSREVLLNLLQPPGSKVLHAQRSNCTLPYQDTEKISFNPDLHGSNCMRCTNVHQASRNPTNRRREMIEEWNQRAWYNSSMNSEGNGHKQNISTNRDATKGHFQDRETVVKFSCPREHLSKVNTARTTSLPITVSCQSREAKKRPLYPEELQLHPDRCQNVPKDHQQYTSGQACFGKDNYTKDGKSAPLHKERQIEQNITMQVNRELPRKDVSQKRMYAPCWHFQSRHSLKNQHPISRQTFVHDHPEMGITSASKCTVVPNTERIPYQLQRTPENEKYAFGAVEERIYRRPSSATQDDRMNHSISPSKNYRREMICPSNEWGLSAVKLSNGPEIRHGEKGFGKPSKSDSQALHHSTNESSQATDIQSDECTPVIVQCYSLSTLTPTLESTPMANSQFTKFQNTGPSVNIDNGDGRVLPSHSRCSYQRHSPKSHKSASRPQSHEDFQYSSPAHRPASNTNRHHHNLIIQPTHSIDESSTSELADNDEQNPSGRAALSEHSHKRCTISSSLPCLTWHPEQQALRSGSDGRRDHNPHNNQWTETQWKASQGVSNQETSHFPHGYQGTRSSLDMHDGHESKETFSNWQTKNVQHEGRQALKIHDYYEERRILVEKVYQDIPGSEEDTKCHQNSTKLYERTRQLCQTNHYQANAVGAEALQTPVCDEGPLQVYSHQRANAVGSRKRKSRQPRPQRLKAGDPTLARETYQHQSQHVEYRQEDFSRSEHHHRANSPYQPEPDASVSEDKRHKRTEVVRVHGNERTMCSYDSVQQPTDPVQQESPTRRDYVLHRTSPKPEVCRNEFVRKTHLPWHTSFPGRVASESSGEKCEQFIEFPRNSHVVSSHELARHRQANCISHEYQTNSYCQSKSPHKHFKYSNVTKRPFNDGRNDIAAQQHWHGPIWMRGPERHLETLEKIRPVYDSTHVNSSTRVFVSHSGPSQHIISSNEGITSQFKTGCDSRWNTPAANIHGEHQGNRFVHHAVSATGKAPNKTSETQPSSPGDNGCDFNHAVEDTVDSDKSFTSVEASVTADVESEPTEQYDASVSENHSFFVHTREVLTNYTAPALKEKRFVCRYCSKKFAHFSTLQNHLRTHTGDKPFQCNFCGRRFAQSGVLKAHLRTHTGDKPFACMYCGKLFAQSTTLTNHLRTHTGHKPYICDFCGKSFSQPSTLRKHELSHTKERPYPCKFCGKAFAQQSTLTNHMRSHTGQRPYKCHFCDKSFAQLSTLDRHLRLHSTVSLKPHRCQYCSKSFSYISNLASHMRNHEQELASSQ